MQRLRQKTGITMLNCHITVHRQEQKAITYQPQAKFEAMSKINPNINLLRKIFGEIDY